MNRSLKLGGRIFLKLIPIAFVLIAFWKLSDANWLGAFDAIKATSWDQILWALVCVVISFIVYACYDFLALKWTGHRLSFVKTLYVSFISTCVAMNVGFSVLSGSVMRFDLYSKFGIGAKAISIIYARMAFLFATGWATVAGSSCIWLADSYGAAIGIDASILVFVGWLVLLLSVVYLLWCYRGFSFELGSYQIALPSLKVAFTNMLVAVLDVASSVGVLHFLSKNNSLFDSTARFIAGNSMAIISQVPGGLGVFEWTALEFNIAGDSSTALGSLLVFRILFFWFPAIIALPLWFLTRNKD